MKLLALWRMSGLIVSFSMLAACGGGATPSPTAAPLKPAVAPTAAPGAAATGAPAPAAAYNIPELANARLKFSGETLAGIFMGDITKWNDTRIAADNAGLSLPNKNIVVVHRSDGSGTSYIWTDYLSSVSDKWKSSVGKSTSVNWPTGLGAKGNEGVSGEVKQDPYSIGYVELAYAMQNQLPVGLVKNKAGQFVDATLHS